MTHACSVAAGRGFDRLGGRRRRDGAGSWSGHGGDCGRVDADGLHHLRRLLWLGIVAAGVATNARSGVARGVCDGRRRRLVDYDDRRRRIALIIHETQFHSTLGNIALGQAVCEPIHGVYGREQQQQTGNPEGERESRGADVADGVEHGNLHSRGFESFRPYEVI